MNARVLLLVLVTGLFMGAWDGDQAVMQAAIAKRSQQRQQAIASTRLSSADMSPDSKAPHQLTSLPVSSTCAAGAVESTIVTPEDAPFSLPGNIADGNYQAVSQDGRTIRVDVSKDAATAQREFYMVDAQDGVRWYLIRLQ